METKELKIIPPEGYEIDKANSNLQKIVFKPTKKEELTYRDIAAKLFRSNKSFVANDILSCYPYGADYTNNPTLCTSRGQAQKLLAINKLMNTAKYLNENWIPDWSRKGPKFYFRIEIGEIIIGTAYSTLSSAVYFKTAELAERAKKILGEEVIKLALSTDW